MRCCCACRGLCAAPDEPVQTGGAANNCAQPHGGIRAGVAAGSLGQHPAMQPGVGSTHPEASWPTKSMRRRRLVAAASRTIAAAGSSTAVGSRKTAGPQNADLVAEACWCSCPRCQQSHAHSNGAGAGSQGICASRARSVPCIACSWPWAACRHPRGHAAQPRVPNRTPHAIAQVGTRLNTMP
jgi:hypothetical protein